MEYVSGGELFDYIVQKGRVRVCGAVAAARARDDCLPVPAYLPPHRPLLIVRARARS